MKIGDRVTTTTKFNKEGVGTGILVGLEVSAGNGNLRTEKDPKICNEILSREGEEGFTGRYIVKCFDKDGSIKDLFGCSDLCFYQSDNVRKYWQEHSDGEEYSLQTVIEGVEYWLPNDENLYIKVRHIESGLEKYTDFYEMDDFLHDGSDYIYVLHGGKLVCKFEAED